jgi:hypothetical protein
MFATESLTLYILLKKTVEMIQKKLPEGDFLLYILLRNRKFQNMIKKFNPA